MKKYVFKKNYFKFIDDLATKKMIEQRIIQVKNQPEQEIKNNYYINQLTMRLHPKQHKLKVVDIEVLNKDTKVYTFKPLTNNAAFFRAGQYLSICLEIDGYKISRTYSLVSSPLDAKTKNIYQIIIKRKPNGYFSNYVLDNLKVNDEIESLEPCGDFHYSFLRDKKNVVAITGGSGVTPFISMAKAIVENSENFNLTIIVGNKTVSDIIWEKQLNEIVKQSKGKVKVVNVLSNEEKKGYETGFIDNKIIEKYCDPNETSFFICGPKIMYKFIEKMLSKYSLEQKYIRFEASNDIGKPEDYNEFKPLSKKTNFLIKVKSKNSTFNVLAKYDETILSALQKAKVEIKTNCLSGKCSWCRVKLIKGDVFSPKGFAHYRAADKDNNIFYTCSTFCLSDIEIEIL